MMKIPVEIHAILSRSPFPLMFISLSGAHLYGFAGSDSDFDLRGVHVLPKESILGLDEKDYTVQLTDEVKNAKLEIVTHDARKFFQMMLEPNGYALEQIFSPLVLHTSPEHQQLKDIAAKCLTVSLADHYIGFAKKQMKLAEKRAPFCVKPLLYAYRALFTGIHLMKNKELITDLNRLNLFFKAPYIPDLIQLKTELGDQTLFEEKDIQFHQDQTAKLTRRLIDEKAKSALPLQPEGFKALNELLLMVRE